MYVIILVRKKQERKEKRKIIIENKKTNSPKIKQNLIFIVFISRIVKKGWEIKCNGFTKKTIWS